MLRKKCKTPSAGRVDIFTGGVVICWTIMETTRTIRHDGDRPEGSRRTPTPGLLLLFTESLPPSVRTFDCAGELTIGRHPDRQAPLQDPGLSRLHATMTAHGGKLRIRDEGSHNGTHVNGRKISGDEEVHPGDIIRVGATLLMVVEDTDPYAAWPGSALVEPLLGGPAMEAVRRRVQVLADMKGHVMIIGESGTGKEVVSRLLHGASGRRGEFVQINCSALTESLFEAQMFGARKGAFTGATANQDGLLRSADHGTLHLDEVGDLPLSQQPKLLRAAEQGEFLPLGASRPVRADLWIVAATHRDLEGAVEDGTFRRDLYHRLRSGWIQLPPLRERREDIMVLATRHLQQMDGPGRDLEPTVPFFERLLLYPWPGNERELMHSLQAAATEALMGESRHLEAGHLPMSGEPDDEEFSRIREALTRCHGNVNEASAVLGLSRGHIYRLLKERGVKASSFR